MIPCCRCRKEIPAGTTAVAVVKRPQNVSPVTLDGAVIARISYYHERCLPPVLFHRFSGSLPDEQSPAASSLGNEHGVGGGLTHRYRRSRKRPSRRKRYRTTEQRRAREREASEARVAARTEAMTPESEFARLGWLPLCHCSKSFGTWGWLTEHGRCHYCGGWELSACLRVAGAESVRVEIAKLAIYDREQMLARLEQALAPA